MSELDWAILGVLIAIVRVIAGIIGVIVGIWYTRSEAQSTNKKIDELKKLLTRSINKGIALYSQDKNAEAINAFDEAIRLDPEMPTPGTTKALFSITKARKTRLSKLTIGLSS